MAVTLAATSASAVHPFATTVDRLEPVMPAVLLAAAVVEQPVALAALAVVATQGLKLVIPMVSFCARSGTRLSAHFKIKVSQQVYKVMKTIIKSLAAKNGVLYNYHQIYSVDLASDDGTIKLVVGSWVDDPTDRLAPTPEHLTPVEVLMDLPLEEFIGVATEKLMELPGWSGTLIDLSAPAAPEPAVQRDSLLSIFPTRATGRIPVAYPV